jgi:hypothetical protein
MDDQITFQIWFLIIGWALLILAFLYLKRRDRHYRYIAHARYYGERRRYVYGKCMDCYYGYHSAESDYPCGICEDHKYFNKAIFKKDE